MNQNGESYFLGSPALSSSSVKGQFNDVIQLLDEYHIRLRFGGLSFNTSSNTRLHKGALVRVTDDLD